MKRLNIIGKILPTAMLALVLALGLAFVSCGGDDGDNNTPGGNTPGGNTPGGNNPGGGGGIISDLQGTWKGGSTLTFSSSNVTCSYQGFGTRTYSVSGNTITFADGAGGSANYTLSADKRTLRISNPTGILAAAVADGSPYTKQN